MRSSHFSSFPLRSSLLRLRSPPHTCTVVTSTIRSSGIYTVLPKLYPRFLPHVYSTRMQISYTSFHICASILSAYAQSPSYQKRRMSVEPGPRLVHSHLRCWPSLLARVRKGEPKVEITSRVATIEGSRGLWPYCACCGPLTFQLFAFR